MADSTLALVLSLLRGVVVLDRDVAAGGWDDHAAGPLVRFRETRLGVVGFGRIGRAVAERALALGFDVWATDPVVGERAIRGAGARPAALDELLRSCRAVTLHAPLTDATHELLGAGELALLPEGAVLVNTARAALVDWEALVEALESGRLAAAAFDVLSEEPPTEPPRVRNLVVTPHAAWYSEEAEAAVYERPVLAVLDVLEGRPTRRRGAGRMSVLRPDANAGKVALVTGGGTGIGRATALALARTGARVAICGRRPEPLAAVETEIATARGECLVVPADVREQDAVDALVDQTLERFGVIDVLVNNAGGQFMAAAEDISPNGWRAVHRLAVDAAWNVTRTVALRSMIPRRGGVVVFVGFSPRRGVPGMAHAAAARAAVENLAAGLAAEWSRYGIRALCVAPGTILTEGLRQYGEERIAEWERSVPVGRLGTPEDVGEVIAFLASSGASYVTGTTVVVDGGTDAWGHGELPPPPDPADG